MKTPVILHGLISHEGKLYMPLKMKNKPLRLFLQPPGKIGTSVVRAVIAAVQAQWVLGLNAIRKGSGGDGAEDREAAEVADKAEEMDFGDEPAPPTRYSRKERRAANLMLPPVVPFSCQSLVDAWQPKGLVEKWGKAGRPPALKLELTTANLSNLYKACVAQLGKMHSAVDDPLEGSGGARAARAPKTHNGKREYWDKTRHRWVTRTRMKTGQVRTLTRRATEDQVTVHHQPAALQQPGAVVEAPAGAPVNFVASASASVGGD